MMNDVRALCSISDPNLVQLIGAYHAPEKGQVRSIKDPHPFAASHGILVHRHIELLSGTHCVPHNSQVVLNSCTLHALHFLLLLRDMPTSMVRCNAVMLKMDGATGMSGCSF